MKLIGMLTAVALIFVGFMIYSGWQKAATLHVDQLRPAVGEEGRVEVFKTTVYEPNTGNAKAYVVMRAGKSKHIGYLYVFHSPPNLEQWTRVSRTVVWDESKGDQPPWIIPYWKLQ